MSELFFKKLKLFAGLTFVLFSGTLFFSSCQKDDNSPGNGIPAETRSINNFIYSNMKYYYLWTDEIPSGIDPDNESDPRVLFDKLTYKTEDKWSYITDDYTGLINSFQGIDKSFGYQFRLFKKMSNDDVFGIVEYVLPGSPADNAGIKRGDVFNMINDTQLNVNNYKDLLFGVDQYKIGFANISDGEIVSNGETADLSAVILQKDPVFLSSVLDLGGEKIGYLVYLQFIPDYDNELRSVFNSFKANGISDLILDFRYNPGGAVNSAQLMASMIAPQTAVEQQKVFAYYIWNANLNDYIKNQEGEESSNLKLRFLSAEAGENLDLDRVFVITTDNTASASELVINALKPYMAVYTVGSNSVGKYTASITLHDQSKSYNWAIQPIVVKLANADNVSDYKDGFTPDYAADDDYYTPLGELQENMLSTAVSAITGIPQDQLARKSRAVHMPASKSLFSASDYPVPSRQFMLINP